MDGAITACFIGRCAIGRDLASVSAAVMSGTRRMSIFATARCGSTVLPPGPVYPATRPSMLMVGLDASSDNESCQFVS